MTQSIKEQIVTFPAIKPELHLREIGREMLCTDSVPASYDAPLKQRERGFHCVRMHISANVLNGVIDRLVLHLLLFVEGEMVDRGFIGEDYVNILAHVLADDLFHGCGLSIFRVNKSKFAITLA